jgi:glucose/arabinose dehydrogenase
MPDGQRSTAAAFLSGGQGIAVDSHGDIFYSDEFGGNIGEIKTDGTRLTFATGLNDPVGLAFDLTGNLYVGAIATVYKFSPSGDRTVVASHLDGGAIGLAVSKSGDVFASTPGDGQLGSGAIYEISTNSTVSVFATELSRPTALTFDASGNLFESDAGTGRILEFTPDGMQTAIVSGLRNPIGLAVDAVGNLFAVDTDSAGNNSVVYEFNSQGRSTFATGLLAARGLAFAVPEPNSIILAVTGGLALLAIRRPR